MASAAIDQWLAFLRDSSDELTAEAVERIATNFVGFDGRERLQALAEDGFASLVLHGHHHVSTSDQAWTWRRGGGAAGDTRILSAGSWGLSPESGKLPRDQPVVMQLLRVDPRAAELRAVLLTYAPGARLAGQISPGSFVLDPQTQRAPAIGLSLPPGLRGRFRGERAATGSAGIHAGRRIAPQPSQLARAIQGYRDRKANAFLRWDLQHAGPTPTTGNRPTQIKLDDMYIPLRFAAELDPFQFDRGASITPDDLVAPRPPQVVVGSAGSGKTTWMRWTFRRLINEPRALPFLLELRADQAPWRPAHDAGRPIDSYLAAELAACGASDPEAAVAALLADPSGPQPVILIDGWDEIGAEGERLRERLIEFRGGFSHVTIIVSSRPYGETRPASAEAFETVHIQPLSDDDIRLLATRFHHHVHGLDDSARTRASDAFMSALAAAPDAGALARTALLLTMMLLLSEQEPLPDRRHKLYHACLRNLLLHRVTERERAQAAIDPRQWRPGDSEERLRVVAELAYRMQAEGYPNSDRATIVRTWDAALALLPSDWNFDTRDKFLRWLVASAGVLTDRTDGSVQFAHLSFQEHLAAYYLFITREGDERVTAARDHMEEVAWWETLRLWAGLIGDQWPDKLGPVLDEFRADASAYWLAGQIFADGTGRVSDFDAWVRELPARLSNPFSSARSLVCAFAWASSKQDDRRRDITDVLATVRDDVRWLDASQHANWCEFARLEIEPAAALLALEAPLATARAPTGLKSP
jgi:hypothetical protein